MKFKRATASLVLTTSCFATAHARTLTFEERVMAQEAIERASYSHQIGASKTFAEAMPRAVVEGKVATYLNRSRALETFWRTPVTAEALRRELERMATSTRMPHRLREIYSALDNDPILVAECVARPVLVDRLTRNLFAFDDRIHGGARKEAEVTRQDLELRGLRTRSRKSDRVDVEIVVTEESASSRPHERGVHRIAVTREEIDRWRNLVTSGIGKIGPVQEELNEFVVRVLLDESEDYLRIASYSVPKVRWEDWWGSVSRGLQGSSIDSLEYGTTELEQFGVAMDLSGRNAAVSCESDDTWDNGSLDDTPDARNNHVAVWTGNVMVMWGGSAGSTGSRYDPVTDTWTPTSLVGAPSARIRFVGVWTGDRMLVWGGKSGSDALNNGGQYDPVTDTWTPMSLSGAPAARYWHTSVWTGSEMIVWGGFNSTGFLSSGARYSPVLDQWTATSSTGAPAPRFDHTATWTGSEMVIWGGQVYDAQQGGVPTNTGARYDPFSNTWTQTSTSGSPTGRIRHTAVWTGTRVIVWGGYDSTNVNTGGIYDPATDSWSFTSTVGAPPGVIGHTATWTGTRMVVWGGFLSNAGGRYDPAADAWTPVTLVNAPAQREFHSVVWTGTRMIVWGGTITDVGYRNTGGSYDPEVDAWTPTSTGTTPPRSGHQSVWTGSRVILWGGNDGVSVVNTGDVYDPATDSWTSTSTTGAPSPRDAHTAVWTGSQMIIWGGDSGTNNDLGSRYDPLTDVWTPVSALNAPQKRYAHTAVWTGSRMIVWGGQTTSPQNTGGQYDPTTDTWTATSTVGAPPRRIIHTAVWTGTHMIVWGGINTQPYGNGGRYNPLTNSWTTVSSTAAPAPRYAHTAVWTGGQMIIWSGHGGPPVYQLNSGGRYDPVSDIWLPTSLVDAPPPRDGSRAAWTGSLMVVWGGYGGSTANVLNSGGRYDPASDSWAPSSFVGAPTPRLGHSLVWTGTSLVVWGGSGGLTSGGRYYPNPTVDSDGDGFRVCDGDCDDANQAIHPGATEVCNGGDDDCNLVADDAVPTPSIRPSISGGKSGTETVLSWPSSPEATGYDAVKGNLGPLRNSGGNFTSATKACIANDVSVTTIHDAEVPPPTGGLWYLIRPVNACSGPGTYDAEGSSQQGSRDAEIGASASACP